MTSFLVLKSVNDHQIFFVCVLFRVNFFKKFYFKKYFYVTLISIFYLQSKVGSYQIINIFSFQKLFNLNGDFKIKTMQVILFHD